MLKAGESDTLHLVFTSRRDRPLRLFYVMELGEQDLQVVKPTLIFNLKKGNIGYLRIHDFMSSEIRPMFDSLYPEILKTSALIIDIRNNHGGNSGDADYILRHLSGDSIRTDAWRSPMYIPAWASWAREQPWYEAKSEYMVPMEGKTIYDKPIVVLVNQGTFSAAEDLSLIHISEPTRPY